MKTLVVYYSRTGITKKVAEAISKKLDAEIEEIIDLKDRKGVIGFMTAGRDALKGSVTEIKPPAKDKNKYDLVIIGSPVWAGTLAPAVRTYLIDSKIKNAAFFGTFGSSGANKTFEEMAASIRETNLLGHLGLTTKEVKLGADKKIEEFVNSIKSKIK